jgi:hypothetical protein
MFAHAGDFSIKMNDMNVDDCGSYAQQWEGKSNKISFVVE